LGLTREMGRISLQCSNQLLEAMRILADFLIENGSIPKWPVAVRRGAAATDREHHFGIVVFRLFHETPPVRRSDWK